MNPKLKAALDEARKIVDSLAPVVETIAGLVPAEGAVVRGLVAALKAGIDTADADADGGASALTTALDTAKALLGAL